jgi:glycosyltransferase involved in cell wall biosynthesis
MPSVSIILPVYNGEQYLSEAIQSILNQTVTDFELIIVNDCSTDSSLQISQYFAAEDERIKVITNDQNCKLPFSLNVGHSVASSEFITWTSDDNILHANFLKAHLDALTEGVDVTYGNYQVINTAGDECGVSAVASPEKLAIDNVIGASFMYRKKVFETIDGYCVEKFLYEDYDFWVRAYLAGFTFKQINEVVYKYRTHNGSLSSSRPVPEKYYRYRYELRKKFPNIDRQIAFKLRTTLFYNAVGILSFSELATLVGEAFMLNPLLFMQQLATKSVKMLRKL